MATNNHVIAQCQWQTRFDDQHNAVALQDALSQWSNHVLPTVIAECFDAYCPSTQIWRIDELMLDLGTLAMNALDQQLPQRVAAAVEEALTTLFNQQKVQCYSAKQPNLRIIDRQGSELDLVRWYLLHGTVPWWDAGHISPLTSVDQQLAEQPNAMADLLRTAGQKSAVRHRIVWQWGEQRTRQAVQVLEPWNANFILSYADNLLHAQQQHTTLRSRRQLLQTSPVIRQDSGFTHQLWFWILTHLIVERGSVFNTQQFVRATLWQMAQHYRIEFSALVVTLSDVAESMQSAGLVAPQFLKVLITLQQEETRVPPHAQPSAATADLWQVLQRLLHTRQAHQNMAQLGTSNTHSDRDDNTQQQLHISELFVRLAQQDAGRTAAMLKQEGASDTVREFVIAQFSDEQLALVVQVVAPREQRFIMTHVAHTQRFLASQRVQPVLIWQVLLAYLLVNTGSYFNRRQFVQVTLSDISRKQRIDYHLLLALLVQTPVQHHGSGQQFELLAILQELQKQQGPHALQHHTNWQQLSHYLLHGERTTASAPLAELPSDSAQKPAAIQWQQALHALIKIQPAHSPKSLLNLLKQHVLPKADKQQLAQRLVSALTGTNGHASHLNLSELRQLFSMLSPQHGARSLQLLQTLQRWQQQARLPQLQRSDIAHQLSIALVQSLLQSISPTRSANQWLAIVYQTLATQLNLSDTQLIAQIQQNVHEDSDAGHIDTQLARLLTAKWVDTQQLLHSYVHIQKLSKDTEHTATEIIEDADQARTDLAERADLPTQADLAEHTGLAERADLPTHADLVEHTGLAQCTDLPAQPFAKQLIRYTLSAAQALANQTEAVRLQRVSELVAELMQRAVCRSWQSGTLQSASRMVSFVIDTLLAGLSEPQQWHYLQLLYAGLFGRVFASAASTVTAVPPASLAALQRETLTTLQQQLTRVFTVSELTPNIVNRATTFQQKAPVLYVVWTQLLQQHNAAQLMMSLAESHQGQQWLAAFLPRDWQQRSQQQALIQQWQQVLAAALATLPAHATSLHAFAPAQLHAQLVRLFWQRITSVWQQQSQQTSTSASLPTTRAAQAEWLVEGLMVWASQQQVSQHALALSAQQRLRDEAMRQQCGDLAQPMSAALNKLTRRAETLSIPALTRTSRSVLENPLAKHGIAQHQQPTVRLHTPHSSSTSKPIPAKPHPLAKSHQPTGDTRLQQDPQAQYLNHPQFSDLLREWLTTGAISETVVQGQSSAFSLATMLQDLVAQKPQLLARIAQSVAAESPQQQLAVLTRVQQHTHYAQIVDAVTRLNALPSAEVNTLHLVHNLLAALDLPSITLREKQQWLQQSLLRAWLTDSWQLLNPVDLLQQLSWQILNSGACSTAQLIHALQQRHLPGNQPIFLAIDTVIEHLTQAQSGATQSTSTASEKPANHAVNDSAQHQREALQQRLQQAIQIERERVASDMAMDAAHAVEFPIAINNAGLALIQSFMRPLFERLQLTENDKFINPAKQRAAVHYLQFLATGQSHTEEHHLLFNKLLCGLAPTQPIEAGVDLTPQEIDTVHSLVDAVTNYWSAIGKTSIDGFRGNWVVRNGTLTEAQDHWDLIVEKRAYDILINRSPLSYSVIKLPWMNKPIYVTWPT